VPFAVKLLLSNVRVHLPENSNYSIMDASQQSIATSMGSSPRFLQAIEDHLPSALLLPEIAPVDGVRSPLAVDLKSRSSTYPQRWNLKNARHAICYSSTANPSCLMSIRSISRPAVRFISTKPSTFASLKRCTSSRSSSSSVNTVALYAFFDLGHCVCRFGSKYDLAW
jgi:hypothetical protein